MSTQAHYECPTCGATKEIVNDPSRTGNRHAAFPEQVPCGWRGCMDYARKADKPEWIPENSPTMRRTI